MVAGEASDSYPPSIELVFVFFFADSRSAFVLSEGVPNDFKISKSAVRNSCVLCRPAATCSAGRSIFAFGEKRSSHRQAKITKYTFYVNRNLRSDLFERRVSKAAADFAERS